MVFFRRDVRRAISSVGMLIPMFLIIGIQRFRAATPPSPFRYTFLGSVFMLTALIYMCQGRQLLSIAGLQALPLTLIEQR